MRNLSRRPLAPLHERGLEVAPSLIVRVPLAVQLLSARVRLDELRARVNADESELRLAAGRTSV
jgi:hypothetical protein